MDPNQSEEERRSKRKKFIAPFIVVLAAVVIFFTVLSKDNASTSNVDGISDEVYEQLVQFFFFISTNVDLMKQEADGQEVDYLWFEDHELYKDAEAYADVVRGGSIDAIAVFPNRLLSYYYMQEPDTYSESELDYIGLLSEFMRAYQLMDLEEADRIDRTINEELRIKDSYNPFDI